MKLITLLLLLLSINGFACEQLEAQFDGRVIEHQKTRIASGNACTYKLAIRKFDTHALCPLHIEDAVTAVLIDERCELKNSQKIGAILVKRGAEIFID